MEIRQAGVGGQPTEGQRRTERARGGGGDFTKVGRGQIIKRFESEYNDFILNTVRNGEPMKLL